MLGHHCVTESEQFEESTAVFILSFDSLRHNLVIPDQLVIVFITGEVMVNRTLQHLNYFYYNTE